MAPARINATRLLQTIDELSSFGRQPDGGISRFTLDRADVEARRYVIELMEESGLRVDVDPFANIVGRLDNSLSEVPAVVCGSHIDSVPHGGSLDGAYGVLSGIEALRCVREQNLKTKAPLEVVVFTEEEGFRFPSFIGSMGLAGLVRKEEVHALKDQNGISFERALKDAGLEPSTLWQVHKGRHEIRAYVELHIEQGPVLEQEQIPIGVVTSIVGLAELIVVLDGSGGHAGTVPISIRRDPMLAAARIVLGVNEIARRSKSSAVATVGHVNVFPNATNVVPENVALTVDYRAPTTDGLQSLKEEIISLVNRAAAKDQVKVRIEEKSFTEAALMSQRVVDVIAGSAQSLGLKYRLIQSGAGHDCLNMAKITETGMIFVPSREGTSHNPRESTDPQHLEAGANVLLNTLMQLAK